MPQLSLWRGCTAGILPAVSGGSPARGRGRDVLEAQRLVLEVGDGFLRVGEAIFEKGVLVRVSIKGFTCYRSERFS